MLTALVFIAAYVLNGPRDHWFQKDFYLYNEAAPLSDQPGYEAYQELDERVKNAVETGYLTEVDAATILSDATLGQSPASKERNIMIALKKLSLPPEPVVPFYRRLDGSFLELGALLAGSLWVLYGIGVYVGGGFFRWE